MNIKYDKLSHLPKSIVNWLKQQVEPLGSSSQYLVEPGDIELNDATKKLIDKTDGSFKLMPVDKLLGCILNEEFYGELKTRSKSYSKKGLKTDMANTSMYMAIVLFSDCCVVLSGHHRLLEAIALGVTHVPVIIANMKPMIDTLYTKSGKADIKRWLVSYNARSERTAGEKFMAIYGWVQDVGGMPLKSVDLLEEFESMCLQNGLSVEDYGYMKALKDGDVVNDKNGDPIKIDGRPDDLFQDLFDIKAKHSPLQKYNDWKKDGLLYHNAVVREEDPMFDDMFTREIGAEVWEATIRDFEEHQNVPFKLHRRKKEFDRIKISDPSKQSATLAGLQEVATAQIMLEEYPDLEHLPGSGNDHFDVDFKKNAYTMMKKYAIECKNTFRDSITSNLCKIGYISAFFYNKNNPYEVIAVYGYFNKDDWSTGKGRPQISKKAILNAVSEGRVQFLIGEYVKKGNRMMAVYKDVRKVLEETPRKDFI